jgi:hypothetical protein
MWIVGVIDAVNSYWCPLIDFPMGTLRDQHSQWITLESVSIATTTSIGVAAGFTATGVTIGAIRVGFILHHAHFPI